MGGWFLPALAASSTTDGLCKSTLCFPPGWFESQPSIPKQCKEKDGSPQMSITLQMNTALRGERDKINPDFIHQGCELPWEGGSSRSNRTLVSKAVEIPRKGQTTAQARHRTDSSERGDDVK